MKTILMFMNYTAIHKYELNNIKPTEGKCSGRTGQGNAGMGNLEKVLRENNREENLLQII